MEKCIKYIFIDIVTIRLNSTLAAKQQIKNLTDELPLLYLYGKFFSWFFREIFFLFETIIS